MRDPIGSWFRKRQDSTRILLGSCSGFLKGEPLDGKGLTELMNNHALFLKVYIYCAKKTDVSLNISN